MSGSLWLHGLYPARLLCPQKISGKNTGVGCHFLLQEIFPTQGSNPCLLCLLRWQVGSFTISTTWEAPLYAYVALNYICFVQLLSHVWLFATPWTAACQASLSITNSWSFSNSCPLSQWGHPTILSSVIPFSSCLQSFQVSGSFLMGQLFTSGGQSIGVSASASVLPMDIQDWFPLGLTGWISLKSKGLSRVFFSTTVQNHQFFGAQLSSQSNSCIYTWPLEKP